MCPLLNTEEHLLKAFVAGVVDPGLPSCFSSLHPRRGSEVHGGKS